MVDTDHELYSARTGHNIRPMCHHILRCRESVALKPRLDATTVHNTIETVITENWLQVVSVADLEEIRRAPQKLKAFLATKTKAEKDIFLWSYTGVLIQTGEWRKFHSYEETWTVLASFWGMRAPKLVPTRTTWPNFHDENKPIEQGNYRRYFRYLDSQRKSALTAPSEPEASGTEPATPMPPRRPPVSLEVLVSLTDSTCNPDLHRGLDCLWTIMDESERNAFLESITTEPTSTSMSTVVPMPAKAAQPAIKPSQPQPPQERQDQTARDDQQGSSGDAPASSSQAGQAEATDVQQGTEPDASETQQDTGTAVEESDRGSTTETGTVQSSQLATAGSTMGGAEQSTEAAESAHPRNHLRNYCQQQRPNMRILKAPT